MTGEVLLSHDARRRVPIASITKLMTVIVALQHLKLTDVVSVDPRAAAVGQESVYLRAGQEITVSDLVKGAMIQSANDAADALALATAPSYPAFAELMNAKAKELGLTDSHFDRPDGLDADDQYSSARDVTRLALEAMKIPAVRTAVSQETGTLADGFALHTWDDLLGVVPGVFGVKTGHTSKAGLEPGRGGARRRHRHLRDDPRQPVAVAAQRRPRVAPRLRPRAVPAGERRDRRQALCAGDAAVRPLAARPEGVGAAPDGRAGEPAADRAGRRAACDVASGEARAGARPRAGVGRRPPRRLASARSDPRGVRARDRGPHEVVRRAYSPQRRRPVLLMIVTVTLNAAFARTITVPNFQRGQRHRASAGLPLAGGKGINVARALKALNVPVVATGFAGGQAGLRIVERLTGEAILNDFVRIEGESRTTTAVVDPTNQSYTEINEWGPAVRPEEIELFDAKLRYLSQGASLVVFAGSLPRGVNDDFYAEAIHDLARRQVPCALDCEGEPLRIGLEGEPFLVTPNQAEAEALVGQEFHDDEDFVLALDQIADRGARNVLITTESGCYALLREDKTVHRYRVDAPRVEAISRVGSGDTLLAGFAAAWAAGRGYDEALREGVAAGAASTLELGAGRFDPREAHRLHAGVTVTELAEVAAL